MRHNDEKLVRTWGGNSPMPNNPLFYPIADHAKTTPLRDQIQIALAIADAPMLRSLLANCLPPILDWQQIGAISTELAVPTGDRKAADGILHFEAIKCVLAGTPQQADPSEYNGWTRDRRELARLTQHESDMVILGKNLSLAATVSLLAESGFVPEQIEHILRFSRDAWHKSWWYAIDAAGDFSQPFLRQIRTLHHPDGSFTLQYRDLFEQDQPVCFTSLPQKTLIAIKPDVQEFGKTLKQINYQRQILGIPQAILICNTISELEAQGFINQGISLYPAADLVLPTRAHCVRCTRRECPMNGTTNSPVATCYGFLPERAYS
jgi:hypothetical protein